jgi:hypothetical protein
MDWNPHRDDNGTDQPRTVTDLYPDPREPYPDPREPYPDQPETYPDQPDTYWRRRAVTLAAGLGLIGLLAWAVSGGGGKPAPHDAPASGALSAPASPSTLASTSASSAASGADAAVPGLTSPGPSGLPSAKASTTGSSAGSSTSPATRSSRSAGPRSTSSASAAQAASTQSGGRCSPSAVVLSLFSSSRSYPAGRNPEFGVDAVSTAPGTCTFGLGPAQLHLVVMSAGRVIWDSADCARGNGAQTARLTRGVPVEEYFTWNRAITLPGCVTLASSARPGSYQAQAKTPAIASGTFTFKLVR